MPSLPERPHAPDVERAALGAMILVSREDPSLGQRTAESLREDDFYDCRNREIFKAVRALAAAERQFDLLAVIDHLRLTKAIDEAGGVGYVATVDAEVPVGFLVDQIVEQLREYTTRRKLIDFAEQTAQDAMRSPTAGSMQVAAATAALAKVEEQTCAFDNEAVTAFEAIPDLDVYLERDRDALRGLPTGIRRLDEMTSGLCPGEILVVAGPTGGGKTAFAIDFIGHQHERTGAIGAVYSREMSAEQLSLRLLARLSGVPHDRLKVGYLAPDEKAKVRQWHEELRINPWIYLDDRAMTAADILARARRLKVSKDIRYLIVDYLQLLVGTGRHENRQVEVAANSRAMKRLAMELEIPVILLSQLSREGIKGGDRPKLHHLRESGAIEQDADRVLFVHYPDDKDEDRPNRACELILEKNRHGATGLVECRLSKPTFRFTQTTHAYGEAVA